MWMAMCLQTRYPRQSRYPATIGIVSDEDLKEALIIESRTYHLPACAYALQVVTVAF